MPCWCGHHGPWCRWGHHYGGGYGPGYGYGPGAYGPPPWAGQAPRGWRRRDRVADLESYLEDLEAEVQTVREELEAARTSSES
jgi:hypothetical protein